MSTTTDSIGRVLAGRYRIESALGTGASAHVFCALDVTLRRRVAIKLLHPALAGDGAFLRRFRAEAQSAAALTHHHVLAVYDWGEDGSGPFLVLEFLAGGSLRDMLDTGRNLSVAQAVSVGAQAADGLAYAHGRGFVHRDIKPANLLFDEEGRLRIADFGLARALSESAVTEPAGATVGTARYAAPEQALGHLVDGRADVYSLALVLYEAVTGIVPFSADTTISTLMARVGANLPGHDALGPLGPVLQAAATPEAEDRLEASDLSRRLYQLARKLPVPARLPLAGSGENAGGGRGLFATAGSDASDRTEHGMRTTSITGVADPAGGSQRAAESETSQVLAMASAVGVATEDYRPTAEPMATLGVPEGPTTAVDAPLGRRGGDRRARYRGSKRWPWITAIVLLALALVGGGLAFAAVQTKFFTPSHRLPNVVDLSVQQASAKLQPDHLNFHVAKRQSSLSVRAGDVIRESPAVGTSLKEGSDVSLVVSTGPPPVPVPPLADVIGDCSTVGAVLAKAHLHSDCTLQYSSQFTAGHVIDWNPKGAAPELSSVKVVMSQGPPIETIPSLTGSTCAGATAELQAVGLVANCSNTYTTSGTPVGQVIPGGWSPSGSATEGSTVNIQISEGPPLVTIPNVDSKTVSVATTVLENAGLVPVGPLGPLSGRVFATNPPEGQSVPEGSQVTLYSR